MTFTYLGSQTSLWKGRHHAAYGKLLPNARDAYESRHLHIGLTNIGSQTRLREAITSRLAESCSHVPNTLFRHTKTRKDEVPVKLTDCGT